MVLYRVVGSSGKKFGYLCPMVAVFLVSLDKNLLLARRPWFLADFRLEVIVPSLSTLLPLPAGEEFRHSGPPARTVNLHVPDHNFVLSGAPGSFGLMWAAILTGSATSATSARAAALRVLLWNPYGVDSGLTNEVYESGGGGRLFLIAGLL